MADRVTCETIFQQGGMEHVLCKISLLRVMLVTHVDN